jgi:hypothetical protein
MKKLIPILLLSALCLSIGICSMISPPINLVSVSGQNESSLLIAAETLSPRVVYNKTYSAGGQYYYNYTLANPSYHTDYQIVWLHPDSNSNSDLQLWNDSACTQFLSESENPSNGTDDWIVFRTLSLSKSFYPKVYGTNNGTSLICGVDSTYINAYTLGAPSPYRETSVAAYYPFALFTTSTALDTSEQYDIILNVSSTLNCGLYIYRMDNYQAKAYGEYIIGRSSVMGQNQYIMEWTPAVNDRYGILVHRISGSGKFQLQIRESFHVKGLENETPISDTYDPDEFYAYNCTPLAGKYAVFWLDPPFLGGDVWARLYSDLFYTQSIEDSWTNPDGEQEWIIWKPTQTRTYYPLGLRLTGVSGSIGVEFQIENATALKIGTNDLKMATASDPIEIYPVYLDKTKLYNFSLTSSDEYDLFLYYLEAGEATNTTGCVAYSCHTAPAIENITNYNPPKNGVYLILTNNSGMAMSNPITLQITTQNKVSTVLLDEAHINPTYNPQSGYLYSYDAKANNYSIVWIQRSAPLELYLYTESTYTTLLDSSVNGAGNLDWILWRPTNSMYYPFVASDQATSAYLEAESALNVTVGSPEIVSPSSLVDPVELYQVLLSNTRKYNITLGVPFGADYTLYLYYLPLNGHAIIGEQIQASTQGSGMNQTITFEPSTTGFYALITVYRSGTGNPIMFVQDITPSGGGGGIPGFEIWLTLVGFIALSFVYRRLKQKF